MSDGRSDEGFANAQARTRARQRARHRTAMHFKAEYLDVLDTVDRSDVTPSGAHQRAYREIARRHPKVYVRYMAEERAKETIIELPRGGHIVHPEGTKRALQRHHRRGEELCDECKAYDAERYGRAVCPVCLTEFVRSHAQQVFCDDDCYWLMVGYFRYHLNWVKSRVRFARSIIRRRDRMPDTQVRHAKSVLAEYKGTGTVTRRYNPPRPGHPTKALAIAEAKGLDLSEVLNRLTKEKP